VRYELRLKKQLGTKHIIHRWQHSRCMKLTFVFCENQETTDVIKITKKKKKKKEEKKSGLIIKLLVRYREIF